MKALRTLALFALLFALCAAPARAQFLGYTFPQTVTQTLTSTGGCTGSNQVYNVTNLGQTVHFVSFAFGVGNTQFTIWIQGVDASSGTTIISDIGTPAPTVSSRAGVVTATGYYAQVQVVVNCAGTGAYTLNYSGTSASTPTAQGIALGNAVSKTITQGGSAGSNLGPGAFVPPFGSTQGYLTAAYTGAGSPSGSTLRVECLTPLGLSGAIQQWTLAATAGTLQIFPVAAQTCAQIQVFYGSGGTSTAAVTVFYNFTPPGFPQQFAYAYVNATNLTAKTGPGFVHTLTIDNIAAAGSYAVYDNTACSGTLISASTLTAALAADTITLDANFQTGLCVTTTGTVSVSYN